MSEGAPVAPPSAGFACHGTGTDGFRVHVAYARASDVPDRFATTAPQIAKWVAAVDAMLTNSAGQTGGSQWVPWLTDPSCNLVVDNIVLTRTGDDSLSATIRDLRDLGYSGSDRKYLTFVDSGVYCGIAEIEPDDRAVATPGVNRNNGDASIPGMIARVDNLLGRRRRVHAGRPRVTAHARRRPAVGFARHTRLALHRRVRPRGTNGDVPVPADYDGDGRRRCRRVPAGQRPVVRAGRHHGGMGGSGRHPRARRLRRRRRPRCHRVPAVERDLVRSGRCLRRLGHRRRRAGTRRLRWRRDRRTAVYRRPTGTWFVSAATPVAWGVADDIALPLPTAIARFAS